jgi:hypothetical protein
VTETLTTTTTATTTTTTTITTTTTTHLMRSPFYPLLRPSNKLKFFFSGIIT